MKRLKSKKIGLVLGGGLVLIVAGLGFGLSQTHLISLNQPTPTPVRTLMAQQPLTVLQTLIVSADNPDNLLVEIQVAWRSDPSIQSVKFSFIANDPSGLGKQLSPSAAGSVTPVLPANLTSSQTGWVTFEVAKQIHDGTIVAAPSDGKPPYEVQVKW
jgi:hypothetical protein